MSQKVPIEVVSGPVTLSRTSNFRSCNRSLEADDPDDTSSSPSSGTTLAFRSNSLKDRYRNQSVLVLCTFDFFFCSLLKKHLEEGFVKAVNGHTP